MKKVLTMLFALTMILSLAACGGTTSTAGSSTAAVSFTSTAPEGSVSTSTATSGLEAKDITVAGLVVQEDQFSKMLSKGYQDAAADAGVKCLLANTGNDQAKELELINTYVSQGVKGIALVPLNEDSSIAALKKANESGMQVAIANIRLSNAPFIVGGFTTEHKDLGRTAGKEAATYIKEKLGGKAKIGIIEFKSQYPQPSADRVSGFLDEVKKVNPNVEVVADSDAWVQDMATSVCGDMLTAHPDINVIFAANDGGAIGSVMAAKNAGLAGKCAVFGIDTGEQQIAMLRSSDNILQAAVGQDPHAMGYKTMELLIKSLEGKDVGKHGTTYSMDCSLLTRADKEGIDKFENTLKEIMK